MKQVYTLIDLYFDEIGLTHESVQFMIVREREDYNRVMVKNRTEMGSKRNRDTFLLLVVSKLIVFIMLILFIFLILQILYMSRQHFPERENM